MPFRAVFTAPLAIAGSSTSTASLFRASSSISAREVSLPVSSSVLQSIVTATLGRRRQFEQRLCGEHPEADACLHVERARSVQPPAFLADGHARQLAHRPHGVEVPDDEHLPGPGAEARDEMIAGVGLRDGRHLGADVTQPSSQRRPAAIDRRLVVGG